MIMRLTRSKLKRIIKEIYYDDRSHDPRWETSGVAPPKGRPEADYEAWEPTYKKTKEHPDDPDHKPQRSQGEIVWNACGDMAHEAGLASAGALEYGLSPEGKEFRTKCHDMAMAAVERGEGIEWNTIAIDLGHDPYAAAEERDGREKGSDGRYEYKLTEEKLKQLIKEELLRILLEEKKYPNKSTMKKLILQVLRTKKSLVYKQSYNPDEAQLKKDYDKMVRDTQRDPHRP